ncbi:hypothetical protein P7M10_24605, partial [Vibrio parahaemolyticus]|nr:hypothetical protein [Vibrio parahaemolyticus]
RHVSPGVLRAEFFFLFISDRTQSWLPFPTEGSLKHWSWLLGMVVHAFDSSTVDAEAGDGSLSVLGQPGLHS